MSDPTNPPRRLLTVVEAAAVIGVSRTTMYQLLAAGEIESLQIGALRRVPIEAIDDFIERHRARS